MPIWLVIRVNLKLLCIKLSAAAIGMFPDRALAVRLIGLPFGALRMLKGVSRWRRLAIFHRVAGVSLPGWLSVPLFFIREAENIIWAFSMHEVDGAIGRHVRFDDMEALKKALQDGRGAIIIGAHYGPPISARLFREIGIETRALASQRTIKHTMDASKYCARFLMTRKLAFTSSGSLLIQSRRSEKALVEHVINGGAVMMLMDFPAASVGGEFVDFLGAPFRFNTFAFKLALRHEVPVFFFSLSRQGSGSFRLSVAQCEGFSTPAEGLGIYKARLESLVLEDPFEWNFSQRYCRWLEQPLNH